MALCPIVHMARQKESSWQPWSSLEKAYEAEAQAGAPGSDLTFLKMVQMEHKLLVAR